MRYPGVDVGEYVAFTEEFYDVMRTVNWLTFLGPSMLRDLSTTQAALLKQASAATVEALSSETVVLKAGSVPRRGDVNRLDIPEAYAEVDKMVRARRCDGTDDAGDPITFFGAWLRTEQWFLRFA
jgi:hypothetical protein